MKIVVTGGAGFIGSHLCERLLQDGHEVICIDNFITGSHKNIQGLKENPRFRLIEHDVTEPLPEDLTDVDQVYHLACPASPVDYREVPLQTAWTSAAGTKTMLEVVAKFDIPFLFASSSEVYGAALEHPQTEAYFGNVNPLGERACYNEGKRFGEALCMSFWRHFGFPLKIVRIFNTYGPRMRKYDGRVIPEFINRALANEPLRIQGDGNQTRSFCYVDDLVEGLIALMQTDRKFIGPVNLGKPEEISMNDLAQKIVELTASESIITHVDKVPDDPGKRRPDIALAQQKIGFDPKISLAEGLKKTIEYYRNPS